MKQKPQNLNQALLKAMETYAQSECIKVKQDGRYQSITYQEFQILAFRLARFFRSRGIVDGERVAIVADNSLDWFVSYIACLLSGGVVVPLFSSFSSAMLRDILQDCGARLVILQHDDHIQTISSSLISEIGDNLPDLKTILAVNTVGKTPLVVVSMKNILGEAIPLSIEEQHHVEIHARNVSTQAIALIAYGTSTARRSKGAVFDHAQNLAAIRYIATWLTVDKDDLGFTLRPWSEVPSLLISLYYFISGIPNVVGEGHDSIAEDMQATSPTLLCSTPYTFERFYNYCMTWIDQRPELTREAFQWAMAKGRSFRAAGSGASQELRRAYTRAFMTFFSQFRGFFGGRLRGFYSTGAVLNRELAEFFEVIGLPVLNVYSLTGAGGFPAASQLNARRLGSCGQIATGFDIRIADDGEILVSGETVMREFWEQPEETRQIFNTEGWLYSGDLGYLDDDNYLFVTGRKRSAVVLSIGYKIVTATIEAMLIESPFITEAAIFGNGKPYISALIVPDIKSIAIHLKEIGEEAEESNITINHPSLKKKMEQVVHDINSNLDSWKQIKKYTLLDHPLYEVDDNLSASVDGDRYQLVEHYAPQIEAMYPNSNYLASEEVTQVQVNPERLRELLEKENILDAWMADAGIQFLFQLARDKHIDVPSMVHICDTVAAIAQMENEEKPLSTALIVGEPVRISQILPPSQIQLLRHDHIRRMRKVLVTLAKMVDGLVLGYVIDKHGYVRGIQRLILKNPIETPAYFLLGPHFSRHADISYQCDAVVFFVPAGGRQARVFADGQLVGRYANGDWSPENMSQVGEIVGELAQNKAYELALLQRILRCAFHMSEENMGAIFVIGNADVILEHSDAPEISHFTLMVSTHIDRLSDQELINFAKQDGATVIDTKGKFRGCMVLLRPDANTQAEIGPGKGARHSSAAKMSAEAGCLAIAVSQDGPITIYDSGRRALSL